MRSQIFVEHKREVTFMNPIEKNLYLAEDETEIDLADLLG